MPTVLTVGAFGVTFELGPEEWPALDVPVAVVCADAAAFCTTEAEVRGARATVCSALETSDGADVLAAPDSSVLRANAAAADGAGT